MNEKITKLSEAETGGISGGGILNLYYSKSTIKRDWPFFWRYKIEVLSPWDDGSKTTYKKLTKSEANLAKKLISNEVDDYDIRTNPKNELYGTLKSLCEKTNMSGFFHERV